jgi:hypothetical protein
MGDLFHDSSSQQSVQSRQVGVSTRDTGGSVYGISASDNAHVSIQSLDPAALNVAAMAVHEALAANTATSLSAFHAYQQALDVTGETTGAALQLAASGAGSGAVLPTFSPPDVGGGITPSTLIWAGVALVAVVLISGYLRK